MTLSHLPPPPANPEHGSPAVSRNRWANRVLVALLFVICVPVTMLLMDGAIVGWALHADIPDRQPRPEMAAAGAAWAGFPDTRGLELVSLEHFQMRGNQWELRWQAGDPDAARRFLAAGDFSSSFGRCDYEAPVDLEKAPACEMAADKRSMASGDPIDRRVTRLVEPDGSVVIHLTAID